MNERHNNESETELQAPSKLIRALKDLPSEKIFVPPYVDTAILRAARQQFAKPAARSRGLLRRLFWPAFAACVTIALLLTLRTPAGYASADVNRDGRVDILDSFALARDLKAGSAPSKLDMNGDGVVDQHDVDALAAQAVRLGKTSS